ncbi:MAG: hypothetical protein EHM47_05080 [Ignavibacteriales bacterium]|nr:MAG: hypothetical protein EHM47_05080 [Ignavibacteriales bacterium]
MKLIQSIIILLLFFYGCDIFSTRDAEKPSEPGTNLPQAFERETLINNFILSHNEKIIDYLNCFSDSLFTGKNFTFIASSEAASQYPALIDWDLRSEENYFRNIQTAAENIPISVILSNSNFSQQGDSLIYTATYSLTVPFTDPGIPQNYQGDLIFHILRDQSLIWRIYFWQDFKSGDSPSWSELKGRFAN